MQTMKQGTTRPSTRTQSTASRPIESAFSAHFLERARRREEAPELGASPLAVQAHHQGPWEIEPVPVGGGWMHAVVRRTEPARDGGGARLVFRRRQNALLAAASLAALATPNHLRMNPNRRGSRPRAIGHPIHDGGHHIGHMASGLLEASDAFLAHFHAVRCLAADPDAAALYIEALDTETLAILGRAAMRRLG